MTGHDSTSEAVVPGRKERGRGDDVATRRRFLSVAAASGGLLAGASGLGTVSAETATPATADDDPAEAVGDLSFEPLLDGAYRLTWAGVADPCSSSLSHYRVLVDGEQTERVPVGASSAIVHDQSVQRATVVAVDRNDVPVAETTVDICCPMTPHRQQVLRVLPDSDTVARGESVTGTVGLTRGFFEGFGDVASYDISVSVSTPCAVEITDAWYPDRADTTEDPIIDEDGATVELSATGVERGEGRGGVTLAFVEFTGRGPAGSAIRPSATAGEGEGDTFTFSPTPRRTTLAVSGERAPDDAPAPPENVSVEQGVGFSMDVSWDGPSDPCAADLSHYAVSIDGTDRTTVPAGVTATTVRPEDTPDEVRSYTVGVRAVDESGDESDVVTATQEELLAADPAQTLSVEAPEAPIGVDQTVEAPLVLEPFLGSVPEEFSFDVTVSAAAPCAVEVTGANYPDGAEGTADPSVADDGSSVTIAADSLVPASDTSAATLATVELTGRAVGHSLLDVSIASLESDHSLGAVPRPTTIEVAESAGPPAIEGTTPTDPDGDGLYEDVNGNGEADFGDVTSLFDHQDDAAVAGNPSYYDFNENGELDFGDVVALFERL